MAVSSSPGVVWLLVWMMLTFALVTSNTLQSRNSCRHTLLHGLEKALWSNESLIPVDVELKKLNAVIAPFKYIEGNSGEEVANLERKIYSFVSKLPCIKTICEIGFNAGHSTIGWLVNNPHAEVVMFDLWGHAYNNISETHIRSLTHLHPERMRIIKGSSIDTVPHFHHQNPGFRCDIISIDGGHKYDIAILDLENMYFLANSVFNILLIDDTNCNVGYCVDKVVQEGQRRGMLKVLEGFSLGYGRGVSVMTYLREV